jgi:hypothetical protein
MRVVSLENWQVLIFYEAILDLLELLFLILLEQAENVVMPKIHIFISV